MLLPNGEFCQFLVKNIFVFLTWSFCFSVSLCMKCCIPGSMLAAMATERVSLQLHGGRGLFWRQLFPYRAASECSRKTGRQGLLNFLSKSLLFGMIRPCKVVSDCLRKADLLSFPLHVPPFKKRGKGTHSRLSFFAGLCGKAERTAALRKAGGREKRSRFFLSRNLADMRETWGRNNDF